ncbi:hypothetical protein [uncultured Duncaniella sp.]|uniref:hypothetical protein n=1 Tax=uncultured Duncaniella sp. TaxID=2768039 RepID=UPI00265971F5|nr:hypothetical protein [uncultured Duncaniella sp.]
MASIPPKKLTLRAFRIENPSLTEAHSHILGLLQQVLTESSTAAQRRMPLNSEDPDRDLLANFIWATNNAYMFGMMLRIIPADNGGMLSEELFNQPTITMADVNAGNPEQSQYKDHFYFALNNDYLITNLAGNINIGRLQTYINWLLESVRGERLFQFTELTKLPDGVPLNQIKDIQFVGGGTTVAAAPTENEPTTLSTTLSNISDSVLELLMGHDSVNLDKIRANQLVEARLFLKLKGKPREMAQEEFQRVMGAIATNVTNDSGIVVRTKDGNNYTGEAVKIKKPITVECIAPNRIVEEQLKQEMELFLNEIRQQNG